MKKLPVYFTLIFLSICLLPDAILSAQTNDVTPILPPKDELMREFGSQDKTNFIKPAKVYYPETWFHFISGNIGRDGIIADLDSIAAAGISGIQLFEGDFEGDLDKAWPGVKKQVKCLTPDWFKYVQFVAQECRKRGLRFTMEVCPGWTQAGGPWVTPDNSQRDLALSRTDMTINQKIDVVLPKPDICKEDWRDYKDIEVLAFITPEGDNGSPIKPESVEGSGSFDWKGCVYGTLDADQQLTPTIPGKPHILDVTFPKGTVIRTIELPDNIKLNHHWVYEPQIHITICSLDNGAEKTLVDFDMPESNDQDDFNYSIAIPDSHTGKLRIKFTNIHELGLRFIRFYSAARQNNWESGAGWVLRGLEKQAEHPKQSKAAYLSSKDIYEVSEYMDSTGRLTWNAPKPGKWTFLRIGHVNSGKINGPAPAEATGWECDKLSARGADVIFDNYLGKMADNELKGGLLTGMLIDSWERGSQTWTADMLKIFQDKYGYSLNKWLPAVFGYVIDDSETTARFLLDWKRNLGDLLTEEHYGRFRQRANEKGMTIQYETASGDIFPADILEYWKYADVPMCELWQPTEPAFVGSLNFKPFKPAASAARMYGKPRVGTEAYTSMHLTWDEHWDMLKEVGNLKYAEGMTHEIFHTFTHNPNVGFLPPGSSFGSQIGTPFIRLQTWWKDIKEFTTYQARLCYMLERGLPVSDVLWYLGDEIDHKPYQNYPFPEGFKYDYCNPDALVNRISVDSEGNVQTPEGIKYKVFWIPKNERMLPETIKKIYDLIMDGATVVGNAPSGTASLRNGYDDTVKEYSDKIWRGKAKGIYNLGKGRIIVGYSIDEALNALGMRPDAEGDALWLHRKIDGADWYYVCSKEFNHLNGEMKFRCKGNAEFWDPLTGKVQKIKGKKQGEYTTVKFELPRAGSCFIVFRHNGYSNYDGDYIADTELMRKMQPVQNITKWTARFPEGWGIEQEIPVDGLKPIKYLTDIKEGKAFSGTATYETTISLDSKKKQYILDLGKVDMLANVYVNGTKAGCLWAAPFKIDITQFLKVGNNDIRIDVTTTWFNRLSYDAGLDVSKRKTWTEGYPNPDSQLNQLRDSGLIGPVILYEREK